MRYNQNHFKLLETVMEELLRAMSAEEAVIAARDVSAAIAAGCDIDAENRSAAVEDVISLLQLLEDFAA